MREEELDRSYLFSGRCFHLAGALVMEALDGEPGARLLAEAKARGLLTSLDTVWDATGRWERVLPALPHVDLFAPSLPEGRAITGEEEPAAVAAWLRERGVGDVVLKCGSSGCYASGEGFEGALDAFPVDAVDGTGAGDAFVAGLLYGRLAGWPLERSARFANAVGALATTAVGAVEGVRGLEETLAFAGLSPEVPAVDGAGGTSDPAVLLAGGARLAPAARPARGRPRGAAAVLGAVRHAGGLLDPVQQLLWQVGGSILGLSHDTLRLAREGAARPRA